MVPKSLSARIGIPQLWQIISFIINILRFGTLKLSGDCVPYAGLDVALAKRRIDIALLPVNGRDDFRRSHGVPGNFTVDEARPILREFLSGLKRWKE